MAKYKNPGNPADVINKWMTNKDSFDFYSLWEELFNDNFNLAESREIKINEVGYNSFTMSPSQWKKFNNAYSLVSTDVLPKNKFYISYDTKKRNAIFLVLTSDGCKRINKVSKKAAQRYQKLSLFKDKKYSYVKEIKSIE